MCSTSSLYCKINILIVFHNAHIQFFETQTPFTHVFCSTLIAYQQCFTSSITLLFFPVSSIFTCNKHFLETIKLSGMKMYLQALLKYIVRHENVPLGFIKIYIENVVTATNKQQRTYSRAAIIIQFLTISLSQYKGKQLQVNFKLIT